MPDIYDWSETAADNATADSGINWAEGQNPSTVNGSARALMSRVASFRNDIAPTRSSTGAGNAYEVTSSAVASGAYNDGEIIAFIADRANTSSCTLNLNSRGAVALRSEVGREFSSGEIRANQPIIAFYRAASNEFLAVGSGYHVNALTSGLLTQSIAGRLLSIGMPTLSLAPSPASGFLRLTSATQVLLKSAWPELSLWLAGLTPAYPWGSTATTFSLPPAAGYFLRFAAIDATVDTGGTRAAGATQSDQNKTHRHTSGSLANSSAGSHSHTVSGVAGTTTAGNGFSSVGTNNSTAASSTAPDHTHTISGATEYAGGDEVRVKNVAMHCDIFASSALSSGTLGHFGFAYQWDSATTASDPGAGRVRGNNASFASITNLYINQTDGWGVDLAGVLSGISIGATIRISRVAAQSSALYVTVSGTVVDNGAYFTLPCSVAASAGTFSNSDTMAVEVFNAGSVGPTGATGTNVGLDYTWNTATSGDPGTGKVLVNNSTPSSATALHISETNRLAASQSSYIATWDNGTTTSDKGIVRILDVDAPGTNFLEYVITGNMSDSGSYDTFPVNYVGSSGSIANNTNVSIAFFRTGNQGASGSGTGDVTGPASSTDGHLTAFDGGTGKAIRSSGIALANVVEVGDLPFLMAAEYGATGDGVEITAAVVTTSGSPNLTVTGAAFTAGDVGKAIVVPYAGTAGATHTTTIATYVSASQITMSDNAGASLAATVTVKYGTDNLTAFTNAIAALGTTGGTVFVDEGIYLVSGTIAIGDGSGGTPSTKNGIRFIGNPATIDNAVVDGSAQIVYAGAGSEAVIAVYGPLAGFAVCNLVIDGSILATYGLVMYSAKWGETSNLQIYHCLFSQYATECYTTANSESIFGHNILLRLPNVTNAQGMSFRGPSGGTTASSCFIDLSLIRIYPSSLNTNYPIVFEVADTITLRNVLVFHSTTAAAGTYGVLYDYTKNGVFPCSCNLDVFDAGWNLPVGQQFVNNGSAASAAAPNRITNLSDVNGCRYPTTLENVTTDLPQMYSSQVALTGQTAAISATTIITSKNAGLYRINYYYKVTTVGTAGTIELQLGYNDGASAGALTGSVLSTSLNDHESGSIVIYSTAASPIQYTTVFTGVTGSPQYSLYITVERMT